MAHRFLLNRYLLADVSLSLRTALCLKRMFLEKKGKVSSIDYLEFNPMLLFSDLHLVVYNQLPMPI
jgi:hypothetical protein